MAALAGLLFQQSVAGHFVNGLAWGVWWPVLVVTFLLLGRLWCTVCPFSTAANLAKKLFSMDRPPPSGLKKYSYLVFPAGFLLILWIEQVFHMTSNPAATAILLLSLIGLAVICAVLFARETWCRYLCPLGSLGAIYSLPATLNVHSNPNVCVTRCTTHECHKGSDNQLGCPVFHHPLYAHDAHVCKLCFNCLKSCPHDSAKLHLRPPLIRIWQQTEAPVSLSLFSLIVFFFSPVLLASRSFSVLTSTLGITVAILLVVAAALLCRGLLLKLFAVGDKKGTVAMSRVAFTLLVLGWGPLMAFQIANFPAVNSLTISGLLGPIWNVLLPESGLSLMKLVQFAAILFAALLTAITFLGIRQRFHKDQTPASSSAWMALIGLFVCYLTVNMFLVLS